MLRIYVLCLRASTWFRVLGLGLQIPGFSRDGTYASKEKVGKPKSLDNQHMLRVRIYRIRGRDPKAPMAELPSS